MPKEKPIVVSTKVSSVSGRIIRAVSGQVETVKGTAYQAENTGVRIEFDDNALLSNGDTLEVQYNVKGWEYTFEAKWPEGLKQDFFTPKN